MNKFTSAAGSHARIKELEDFCFSDFHKDVYGFRPRGATYERFVNASPDDLTFWIDNMFRIMDDNQKAQEVREAEALVNLKAKIKELIASGASDWNTALRWMMDAEEEDNLGFFLWGLDISFEKQNEIVELYYAEEA